jgi:hypothetical protein
LKLRERHPEIMTITPGNWRPPIMSQILSRATPHKLASYRNKPYLSSTSILLKVFLNLRILSSSPHLSFSLNFWSRIDCYGPWPDCMAFLGAHCDLVEESRWRGSSWLR